jgi:hypothetical protein
MKTTADHASAPAASSSTAIVANLRRSALLALPFQVTSVALAIALSFFEFDFAIEVWLAVILVAVYWVPLFTELAFRTTLPWPLQLSYLGFIAVGPYAGSALHVYWTLWWWDIFVHFWSGIMLAWLGMLFVRRAEEQIGADLPRWLSLTVVLMTPMAFGAAWEICEFASDFFIGSQTQHGLDDSMSDLLAGTVGGLVAILIVVFTHRPRSLEPHSLGAVRGARVR